MALPDLDHCRPGAPAIRRFSPGTHPARRVAIVLAYGRRRLVRPRIGPAVRMHLKSIGDGGSGHRRALQRISAHLESISPARIDPPSSAGGLLAGGGPQCRCPDRPPPAPLLRFASPPAHSGRAALPGVATHPGDPASALSSSLAGTLRRVCASARSIALAVFRVDARAGSPIDRGTSEHRSPPSLFASGLMLLRGRRMLARRATWPGRGLPSRRRSWGSTLRSLDPVRGRQGRFRRWRAHMPLSRIAPTRPFSPGDRPPIPVYSRPVAGTGDRSSSVQKPAPGIRPRGQAVPSGPIRSGRSCLGFWVLSQVFGHPQPDAPSPARNRREPTASGTPFGVPIRSWGSRPPGTRCWVNRPPTPARLAGPSAYYEAEA